MQGPESLLKEYTTRILETEDRFRIMADCAPVLLWMAEKDGRCIFFNRRWLDFTGRTLEQERDFGWSEGVHPEDFQFCVDTFMAALSSRKEFAMEYRLRRYDGQYRWVYDMGTPRFLANQSFAGYIGSCVDVTERREFEEVREQILSRERKARAESDRLVEELGNINRMKDEFLATLSHELRTPLNAVLGFSEILINTDARDEDYRTAVESIHRNAKIQVKLINDLLDLSRIISGKIKLENTALQLLDVATQAVASVKTAAEAKRIEILMTNDDSVGPVVGDFERLQQVFWNLLSNAIRHTPPDGEITVEIERENDVVAVRVRDSGEGIDPAFLPHVFDRFRQADGSITRRHGGLGIGLSIVKHLVELHGGKVEAESFGKGFGAVFTVKLPLAAVRIYPHLVANNYSGSERHLVLRGLKILAVDDQGDALQLVATILRRQGADVLLASSVRVAYKLFQDHGVDLILTDVGMPGESGYDLVRMVKAQPHKQVPVVALTAHTRKEDVDQAYSMGFDFHLPKPVEAQALIDSIEKLTLRQRVTP